MASALFKAPTMASTPLPALTAVLALFARAKDIVEKFRELDKDNSGKLDADEARAGLKELKTGSGRVLEDKEIDFFIKTTAGDDNMIDLGHFTNMLYRLKLYKGDPPSRKH